MLNFKKIKIFIKKQKKKNKKNKKYWPPIAKGKRLDRIGEMWGVSRNQMSDRNYRNKIKEKMEDWRKK